MTASRFHRWPLIPGRQLQALVDWAASNNAVDVLHMVHARRRPASPTRRNWWPSGVQTLIATPEHLVNTQTIMTLYGATFTEVTVLAITLCTAAVSCVFALLALFFSVRSDLRKTGIGVGVILAFLVQSQPKSNGLVISNYKT